MDTYVRVVKNFMVMIMMFFMDLVSLVIQTTKKDKNDDSSYSSRDVLTHAKDKDVYKEKTEGEECEREIVKESERKRVDLDSVSFTSLYFKKEKVDIMQRHSYLNPDHRSFPENVDNTLVPKKTNTKLSLSLKHLKGSAIKEKEDIIRESKKNETKNTNMKLKFPSLSKSDCGLNKGKLRDTKTNEEYIRRLVDNRRSAPEIGMEVGSMKEINTSPPSIDIHNSIYKLGTVPSQDLQLHNNDSKNSIGVASLMSESSGSASGSDCGGCYSSGDNSVVGDADQRTNGSHTRRIYQDSVDSAEDALVIMGEFNSFPNSHSQPNTFSPNTFSPNTISNTPPNTTSNIPPKTTSNIPPNTTSNIPPNTTTKTVFTSFSTPSTLVSNNQPTPSHANKPTTTNIISTPTTVNTSPLPTVVIHLIGNQPKNLIKASSFSDLACSPSCPVIPIDPQHNNNHGHKDIPHNKTDTQLNCPHLNTNDNTVQSGPELYTVKSNKDINTKRTPKHNKNKTNHKNVDPPKASKEKKKKTSAWYNVLSPSYKSRSEDFKRIFKTLPVEERLLVEYSCALQKDILIQGRMYVSQGYMCFYANIFRWETVVVIKCSDICKLTKEKTARVIPNAIQIRTNAEKFFFASFGARDKVFKQLELVRRNSQMGVVMNKPEFWSWVHLYYGDDLSLTSDDDDDYEPLTREDRSKFQIILNTEPSSCSLEESTEACVALENQNTTSSSKQEAPQHHTTPATILKDDDGGNGGVDNDDPVNELSDEEEIVDFCSSHRHNSIEVLDEAYHIPVDTVFEHIFADSSIFQEFAKSNKMIDLNLNPWEDVDEEEEEEEEERDKCNDGKKKRKEDDDGLTNGKVGKRRRISYTLLLNLSFGPKKSPSRENQVMYAESEAGQFYLIDSDCFNDNIPYGENFYISNRYCISRISNNRSRLKITSQIKYKKSCWGFIKNFLAKNVTGGINTTFSSLADLLRVESDRLTPTISSFNPTKSLLDPYRPRYVPPNPSQNIVSVSSTSSSSSPKRRALKGCPLESEATKGSDAFHQDSSTINTNASSLDSIVRPLCLLMLLLLFFNGIFFYKLWGLEMTAARLVKARSSRQENHHDNHHENHHDNHPSNPLNDKIHTNQLNQHRSMLEEVMKEQMRGPQMAASDWTDSQTKPPSEGWIGGKRQHYRMMLESTLKLMNTLSLTMQHIQQQLRADDEDGGGGGSSYGGDSGGGNVDGGRAGDDGGGNNGDSNVILNKDNIKTEI